jgi:hypothetical protein
MKSFIILCALFAIASGVTAATKAEDNKLGLTTGGNGGWKVYPAANPIPGLPRVLLIGDSIVGGYRGVVARELRGKANVDVWLTGAAESSPGLLDDLKKVLAQGPYAVVHFNIGLHGWPKGRIPEGQYEPIMRKYVATTREHAGNAKLIWASSTPITEKGKPTELDAVNNPTIVERNRIAAGIMKETGIAVNDLHALVGDKLNLAAGDKFHWKGPAYELMGEQVARFVAENLTVKEL